MLDRKISKSVRAVIDLEKAYNRMARDEMWPVLSSSGWGANEYVQLNVLRGFKNHVLG